MNSWYRNACRKQCKEVVSRLCVLPLVTHWKDADSPLAPGLNLLPQLLNHIRRRPFVGLRQPVGHNSAEGRQNRKDDHYGKAARFAGADDLRDDSRHHSAHHRDQTRPLNADLSGVKFVVVNDEESILDRNGESEEKNQDQNSHVGSDVRGALDFDLSGPEEDQSEGANEGQRKADEGHWPPFAPSYQTEAEWICNYLRNSHNDTIDEDIQLELVNH